MLHQQRLSRSDGSGKDDGLAGGDGAGQRLEVLFGLRDQHQTTKMALEKLERMHLKYCGWRNFKKS